jgi:hypothetical protein
MPACNSLSKCSDFYSCHASACGGQKLSCTFVHTGGLLGTGLLRHGMVCMEFLTAYQAGWTDTVGSTAAEEAQVLHVVSSYRKWAQA